MAKPINGFEEWVYWRSIYFPWGAFRLAIIATTPPLLWLIGIPGLVLILIPGPSPPRTVSNPSPTRTRSPH